MKDRCGALGAILVPRYGPAAKEYRQAAQLQRAARKPSSEMDRDPVPVCDAVAIVSWQRKSQGDVSFNVGEASLVNERLEAPLFDRIGSRSHQHGISLHRTRSLHPSIPAYKNVEDNRALHVACLGVIWILGLYAIYNMLKSRSLSNDRWRG